MVYATLNFVHEPYQARPKRLSPKRIQPSRHTQPLSSTLASYRGTVMGFLTRTITPNSMKMPTIAFSTKSSRFRTIHCTVDDRVGWRLSYSYLPVDILLMGGLRLVPIRRTQNDIDGRLPSSDDVAQTMVDHSSSAYVCLNIRHVCESNANQKSYSDTLYHVANGAMLQDIYWFTTLCPENICFSMIAACDDAAAILGKHNWLGFGRSWWFCQVRPFNVMGW